jgi:polysaccharide deacetylase family protein (PEP-CTERM system associated)
VKKLVIQETSSRPAPRRNHILTIALEEYFHGMAFAGVIDRRQWSRLETRFERNTLATLDLLDEHQARATFFVMAWLAERRPDVVREVVRRGHEIASSGATRRSFRQLSPEEFRGELRRSRDVIERASERQVLGFRVADRLLKPADLWALEVLAQEGYAYDSSVSPSLRSFHGQPWRRFVHRERFGEHALWEFPLSALHSLGVSIPIAGGNYFRQFPQTLIKAAVNHWDRAYDHPFVMYFRVWDLDADQPRITAAPMLARIRHYRNAEKMPRLLRQFLASYRFTGVAEFLGLEPQTPAPVPVDPAHRQPSRRLVLVNRRERVSVVVPCFNEELTLPYLANTLREVRASLADRYELLFLFVDDGSRDQTGRSLSALFGDDPHSKILRHARNQGVAAAILTGIRNAQTPVVCSIDCDCTYDPHELGNMIPMLAEGADLVTASPYHPNGAVLNVPRWRLALSKTASALYRAALGERLHTYTSCFRVYRREAVAEMQLSENGFLGVAEMLGKLALAGARIVEHPATLEVRLLGRSKMRVARTIAGHLKLLLRFAIARRTGPKRSRPEPRGAALPERI